MTEKKKHSLRKKLGSNFLPWKHHWPIPLDQKPSQIWPSDPRGVPGGPWGLKTPMPIFRGKYFFSFAIQLGIKKITQMNLRNQNNWTFFDPSRPKTAQNGLGYEWSAAGPILSFCIFSGPKFTILSWRSTSTLTKNSFGTFSDSFSLALNKVARYHPKRTKNGLCHSRSWSPWQNGKFGTRKNTKTQNWACGWPLVARAILGSFWAWRIEKCPIFLFF